MRLFGNSLLQFWGPKITKHNDGVRWWCKYRQGGTVADPACVFWNHISVGLKIGRLFVFDIELMWGEE